MQKCPNIGALPLARMARLLTQVQALHHKMFLRWWSFAWGYARDDVLDVQYLLSCMGCFVVRPLGALTISCRLTFVFFIAVGVDCCAFLEDMLLHFFFVATSSAYFACVHLFVVFFGFKHSCSCNGMTSYLRPETVPLTE